MHACMYLSLSLSLYIYIYIYVNTFVCLYIIITRRDVEEAVERAGEGVAKRFGSASRRLLLLLLLLLGNNVSSSMI